MVDGHYLEKQEKPRYLRNRVIDFDEIWQGDAYDTTRWPLRFPELDKKA